jgi:hypothetical protein
VLLDDVDAELHADDEHVEREAQLRRREQVALGVARLLARVPREDPRLRLGRQQAEQRRPEHDAGDHLGDDLRLAEALGDEADQSADQQDHRDLREEVDGERQIVHGRAAVGAAR